MRYFQGLAGVVLGTGLSLTGATVVVGCGEDFNGCEASRTCTSGAGTGGGGMGATGGKGGASGASSGKGGGGKGGSTQESKGGKGGTSSDAGAGGEADAGPTRAGTGGVAGSESDAGASGQAGGGGEAGGDGIVDRPQVVTTLPTDGAIGVLMDTQIIVTFDHPMDSASTQSAYESEDLPAGEKATLSWLENGTQLLITPNDDLSYDKAKDKDAPPNTYTFTIHGTAEDQSGVALGQDFTFSFAMLRHFVQELHPLPGYGLELVRPDDGSADVSLPKCDSGSDTLQAGRKQDDTNHEFVVGFDLALIADDITDWSSATFRSSYLAASLTSPFGDDALGVLKAYSVIVDLEGAAWDVPVVSDLGVFEDESDGEASLDVLARVQAEYSTREQQHLTKILVRFSKLGDLSENQLTRFSCEDITLALDYYGP